jgi:hypothetical protein
MDETAATLPVESGDERRPDWFEETRAWLDSLGDP